MNEWMNDLDAAARKMRGHFQRPLRYTASGWWWAGSESRPGSGMKAGCKH